MDRHEDGSNNRRTLKEGHVSTIQEPDSIFIGHVSTGWHKDASTTSEAMLEYFEENSNDHSKLIVIGCDDGTSVNKAKNNGIIRKFKTTLKRSL